MKITLKPDENAEEIEEFFNATTTTNSDEINERDWQIIDYFGRACHILNAYQAHQSSAKELRMSSRAMQLALGFTLAAAANGPTELAKKCGFSKATVGKCVNYFIAQLALEPLPGQRKEEGRKNMARARKAQLKR